MLKNLKLAIREKFILQKFASEALRMNPGNLSKLIKTAPEDVHNIRPVTLHKLEEVFPEYNIDWLLGLSKIKYKHQLNPTNTEYIGQVDEDIEFFNSNGETKFYEVSPGSFRMKVPLITEPAKAGFLTGFQDWEQEDTQTIIHTTVNRYHKGRYIAFKVNGDSMDVDSRVTFQHGDIIIGREIPKQYWNTPFHTHRYPFYVFITLNDGIIFKEMIGHDPEKGIVNLRSLNPDKSTYPDFSIPLSEVKHIFNIVKREVEI